MKDKKPKKRKSRATGKPIGRPSKWRDDFPQRMIDYFSGDIVEEKEITKKDRNGNTVTYTEIVANDLPLFSAFCAENDITTETMHQWIKQKPIFSDAYKKAKLLQERFLVTNSLQGRYEKAFAIFTAKNILGWRDVKDIDAKVTGAMTVTGLVEMMPDDDESI